MKESSYITPIIVSLSLHLLLIIGLVWGTDFNMSPKKTINQPAVQAVMIDQNAIRQQAQQIRAERQAAAKAEQDRLDKLRRQSEELEKNRKVEEERIRRAQQEKARAEKAAIEAKRKKEELERKRKAEQEAAKKAEIIRKKKEQERIRLQKEKAEKERIEKEKREKVEKEKARKEQQRLEKLEREKKQQQKQTEAALSDIFAGISQEEKANAQARQRGVYVQSEVDRYSSIYMGLIQQNLLVESSFYGKECKLNIRLIPTGTDMLVKQVKRVSGDARLCSAAERAVAQVGRFPQPKSGDEDVLEQLKNINLTVIPE